MALIPPDAGIRMRMQTESNLLQPAAPGHDLASDQPDLRPGQRFAARIQETLPDNTYKALVAGKQMTLQLPESAKAGDLLELVVVDRSGKAIIARQAAAGGAPTGNAAAGETGPYPFAKFSPAARLIGQLLTAEGGKAPAVPLNRGQPLLPQAPQSQQAAAQLAPTLAKAITQSGVFYESHQAQWVTGKLPLAQLLQEPQGQRSLPAAHAQAAAEMINRTPPGAGAAERAVTSSAILQTLQAGAEKVGAGETAARAAPTANLVQTAVPDALRPLVQQQLDAVAMHRLAWHGEVWPRQTLDLEIEWEKEREGDGSEDDALRWQTTLSLTTPRLGRVDANLHLTAEGVRIRLATPTAASAVDMREAAPQLAEALAAAGVPLLGVLVKHENEYPTPSAEAP